MKERVAEIISKTISMTKKEILNLIETPPSTELGDFAFPCFSLAKTLKESPGQIASNLSAQIKSPLLEKVEAKGPYINFFLDKKTIAQKTLDEINSKKDKYGHTTRGKNKKIVIEMSSPNIAKPFGVGHLRSTIIGNAISNLFAAAGYKTVKINYLGDWGTPFGKVIAGYKHFGSEKELKKDPIKHLYECYVKANKNALIEDEARAWFRKMENEDEEAISLWNKFRKASLENFQKIYSLMNIKFDVISGESEYRKKMEKTISILRRRNLLKVSDGAEVVNLEKESLGVALIKKSDGATLYITRDITAAIDRRTKYKFEKMIYEVGSEQSLYFRQLFKILELMGYEWAKNCAHASHGLYLGEDSKKLSTRKGKTIFMEEIIEETKELAKKEIEKRDTKISARELNNRALKIALAAIFYGDLRNYRENNIIFDLENFISFEGNTGPYLLYTYARAKSILKKARFKNSKLQIPKLSESEKNLVMYLQNFTEVVEKARQDLAPNYVANYTYNLAQKFNEFYHAEKVLGSEQQKFRLALVEATAQVLKNGLNLLGIRTLERM